MLIQRVRVVLDGQTLANARLSVDGEGGGRGVVSLSYRCKPCLVTWSNMIVWAACNFGVTLKCDYVSMTHATCTGTGTGSGYGLIN